MQQILIGPTRSPEVEASLSRSVLGSLNDFSFLSKAYLQDGNKDNHRDKNKVWLPHDLAVQLSGVPCSPVKSHFPRQATLELLAQTYRTLR